jgi:hypothetical protein
MTVHAVKLLGQAQLGTSLTTIYTVPSYPPSVFARVNAIWVANTDSAVRTVTLRVGTGTLTAANSLIEDAAIPANTSWLLTGSEWGLTIGAGYTIQALSDVADKVTITISGDETQ